MNSMYHTCRVAPDVVRAHPNPNHNPDPNLESTLASMYHTSPERASPIEKPSMSDAYPYLLVSSCMVVMASRAVAARWSVT